MPVVKKHRGGLMPSVLFLAFLLPQLKLLLFFLFPLFAGAGFPFLFALLMFELQRLLCLGSDPFVLHCVVDFTLHPFGIHPRLSRRNGSLNWRTELQAAESAQYELVDLIVLLFVF